MYFVKSNILLKALYPQRIWKKNVTGTKILYLTFDDGPHETATPFVLDTLQQFNAKATFFCIGKNVVKRPGLFEQIKKQGHAVGNHTFNHLNGWKTSKAIYLADIAQANRLISSPLFRPPYGRMKKSQEKQLLLNNPGTQIIMWDVLSGDFDTHIPPQKCWKNILRHTENGSIIVFHDSAKAFERMQYALPKTLTYFSEAGYRFEAL